MTKNGWLNDVLQKIISDRQDYAKKQSENGMIGQFWKKAKAILNKQKYNKLKDLLYYESKNEMLNIVSGKEIDIAMLEALLKHLEIVNEDVIVNEDEIEGIDIGGMGKKKGMRKIYLKYSAKNIREQKEGLILNLKTFRKNIKIIRRRYTFYCRH